MTTTADFYDGRGPHAVWLGSLQTDADPTTIRTVACGRLMLESTDPTTYADAVADLLEVWTDEHGHGYHMRDGWPWPWPDSQHTDWVYTFTHGRVWITTGQTWRPRWPTVIAAGNQQKYDHTHCPSEAHHRNPGTSIDDGQRVDESGQLLCNHCAAPLLWCATVGDYDHVDPTTPPCFLVHRPEDTR
jgi:hypothetical protein